jgi:hypothetical protein
VSFERFINHVFNDGARRVEGACLLAGSCSGLFVIGGEQVFKDLAQQLRIKSNFLIDRRVFDNGELVGVQDMQKAANLLFPSLGVTVSA